MAERIYPAYPLDITTKEALGHITKAIPSLIKLLFRLMKDRDVPLAVKIWIGGTALYLISPINIPFAKNRIFPFKLLRYLDDIVLVLLTLQKSFRKTPWDILNKHWDYSMPLDQWNDLVFKIYTDLKSAL